MILSILIPSTYDRQAMTKALCDTLARQAAGLPVEVLTAYDNKETPTGTKRNQLLDAARGEYVAFVDSDDAVATNYVTAICQALEHNPDCVGFKGYIYQKRVRSEWIISNALPYVEALIDRKTVYLRHTNHLAPVRRSIALLARFPDIYVGEDYEYALRLRGKLRSEVFIDSHLYHYKK